MSRDEPNPPQGSGIGASFSSLGAHAIDHLRLRLGLLEVEGKEAGVHYVKLIIWLVAALVFALLGYILLLIATAFLIATYSSISWMWIALAAAGIHLLLVVICVGVVKSKLKKPVLQATMQELKQDAQWLKSK